MLLTCILQILESSSSDNLLPSNSMIPLILSQYWAWSMFPGTEKVGLFLIWHQQSLENEWSTSIVWASYPPVLLIRLSSPPASPTACPCQWHFLPSWTQCSLLSTLSPDRQIQEKNPMRRDFQKPKSTRTWQIFYLWLKRLAGFVPDLFEGVHLGGEVRRLEHAQQCV